jgi:hypothetical protein
MRGAARSRRATHAARAAARCRSPIGRPAWRGSG